MRIRTDGDYAHREDTIERIAAFYDRNKTYSMLRAADDLPAIVDAIKEILQRDDLTPRQKREIADTVSTTSIDVTVDENVDVSLGGE